MTKDKTSGSTRKNKAEVLKSRRHILDQTELCSLATVNDDGTPHINTAFFCSQGDELFFLSDIRSKHCQNILKRPQVAISIFDSRQNWNTDKVGIQIFGEASVCHDKSAVLAQKKYAKRFPKYATYVKSQKVQIDENFQFISIRILLYKILDEKRFGEENLVTAHLNGDGRANMGCTRGSGIRTPPSRPAYWQIEIMRRFLRTRNRREPVAVLGSTPEFRDLLAEMGFGNVYIFENNLRFYKRMKQFRCYENQEHLVRGDWLQTLPDYANTFVQFCQI